MNNNEKRNKRKKIQNIMRYSDYITDFCHINQTPNQNNSKKSSKKKL